MERAAPSPCLKSPWLGPTAGSIPKEETMTLVGPKTPKESLQTRNNRLGIPITVLGIQSHSKTSKYMIIRGGQTFPKSTEFRNSVLFHPFFGSPFPYFSVRVAESVPSRFSSSHDVLTYWEANSG